MCRFQGRGRDLVYDECIPICKPRTVGYIQEEKRSRGKKWASREVRIRDSLRLKTSFSLVSTPYRSVGQREKEETWMWKSETRCLSIRFASRISLLLELCFVSLYFSFPLVVIVAPTPTRVTSIPLPRAPTREKPSKNSSCISHGPGISSDEKTKKKQQIPRERARVQRGLIFLWFHPQTSAAADSYVNVYISRIAFPCKQTAGNKHVSPRAYVDEQSSHSWHAIPTRARIAWIYAHTYAYLYVLRDSGVGGKVLACNEGQRGKEKGRANKEGRK